MAYDLEGWFSEFSGVPDQSLESFCLAAGARRVQQTGGE